jgi:hypothetical protein
MIFFHASFFRDNLLRAWSRWSNNLSYISNTWWIVRYLNWSMLLMNMQNNLIKSIKYWTCDHSVSVNLKYFASCLSWYLSRIFFNVSALINMWHVESQRVFTFWKSLRTLRLSLFFSCINSSWILQKFSFRRLLLLIYTKRARI